MLGSLGSIATSTDDGTDSELVYHHKDHLGGTHVETDESGAVLEYIIYKPFGGTLVDSTTGSYSNDRKYTGKEKDSDTGYYYYGARYYMSDYGRFMSQDPVYLGTGTGSLQFLGDPQSLNSYSYSRNNPINFYDPDGQWGEWVWKFVAATEKFFNLGTAVVPFVSDIRDFVEVVTGRDAITNQPLTKDQHELTTAVMFAPILSGGVARKADDLLGGALSGMGKVTRYSTALDNVSVISKGKLIYQGSRDLTSVVDDILGGSRHGDGMYRNSNGVLPTQEAGYYQKYYLNTPEMSGGVTGPERIVTGKKGEVYYTPDHYDSFTQIK